MNKKHLSPAELDALARAIQAWGRNWKDKLSAAWASGNYRPLPAEIQPLLQQVRNNPESATLAMAMSASQIKALASVQSSELPQEVESALAMMSRNEIEDLLDEHLGVGCNDEMTEGQLLLKLRAAIISGQIPASELTGQTQQAARQRA